MKNRWKNAMNELRKNRGSGVVLVLVAISCITLMTTSLLHLSYTAFKIKASDRQSKEDFYVVDAKMDELMAGIQDIASEAIAEAQKRVFIDYTSSVTEATFRSKFKSELEEQLGLNVAQKKYSVSVLAGLLNDSTVSVTSDNNTYLAPDGTNEIILQNVCLSYVSEKSGNLTNIKMDIVIDCGELSYSYVDPGDNTYRTNVEEWNLEEIVTYENWSTY